MKTPAKYKMAILIWLVVYPAINVLFFVFEKPLQNAPMPIKTLVISLILVPSLVYVFLPLMTKWFRKWLEE